MIYKCLAVLGFLSLAACGGGGDAGNGGATPPPAPPPGGGTLSGASPNAPTPVAGQSALSGTAILTQAGLGDFVFAQTVGLRTDASGALTLTDANYSFNSDGTFDSNGRLTDADGAFVRFVPLDQNYAGTRVYEGSYAGAAGPTSTFLGVFGDVASNLPTGSANYAGEVFGAIESNATSVRFEGRSRVFVDFSDNEVDVILDQIAATATTTGNAATSPVSEVRIVDMDLSDGVYTGGSVSTLSQVAGQPAFDLLGPGVRISAQGELFGNGGAATGGSLAGTGFNGAIAATWVADQK